ncbi:Pyruvate/2-oxoglutarate dehydrogenase complex, dihydrolipoamide dehydrogenase (E3) component [Paramicrobacterium humi]|uniref:Pyruvate/2-oxoglutarate dehydrogenase complex, dihydrolipoamide dehydrogenase (E3) component n=1 Tax=Paramicrobacterium humi TaxID=640635 RepID=A0A1H4IZF7_9MICO|nr:FAD-dependent oxidoreductase [Microbacterium humi]SEB39423.1 Pyruvate/2-oxoglutarate dehydrogenase complex, dihydrolipoamide dehydrogenase (E3) component [Microbacterium humi]
MDTIDVELAVIGWGKGGKTLARTLASSGRKIALIEQSPRMYGGSCINVACVPTKALITSASTRRDSDDPDNWFTTSVVRRDTLTGAMNDVNFHMVDDLDSATVIDGRARFVEPRRLEVETAGGTVTVLAQNVVVNVGTTPGRTRIPGADEPGVYDSTTIQHASPRPSRLVIIGAGVVGVEFATMFAGFGTQVDLLGRSERLLPGRDRAAVAELEKDLRDAGIGMHLGFSVDRIERVGHEFTVHAGERTWNGDAVLLASGRSVPTDDLGLDAAGIDVDERGYIVVDEKLRTSADGVYAVGDCNGGPQQTYISLDDFRIVLDQLTGDATRSTADRTAVPTTIFTVPPFASVGLTAEQAAAAGHSVLASSKPVAKIAACPRPKILGDPRGVISFVVDAHTDAVLGCTWYSVDAQDVINLVSLAMDAGVTATQLRNRIYTHPSTAEAMNEVLGELTPFEG